MNDGALGRARIESPARERGFMTERRRGWLISLAKLAISVAIVTYLVHDVRRTDPDTFARLRREPKDWTLLCCAWACFVGALMLGWMRWRALASALGLRISVRDAARL